MFHLWGLTFPLVWSYLLLAVRAFSFYDALKRLMGTKGSRKVWCGLRQILFHQRERKILLNPYWIPRPFLRPFGSKRLLRRRARKQRFTFASSKRKTQTATEAEAQQSCIGDFPHSTLGKRPPPNRNNLFETPRNRPIFAPWTRNKCLTFKE